MVMLLDIEGNAEAREGTVSTISRMTGIRRVHRVDSTQTKTSVLAMVDKPSVCRASEKAAILCLDCPFDSTEMPARWEFVAKSQDDVWKLMIKLQQEGIEAVPKGVTILDPKVAKSNREREIIALATEWGFFEYPRRITLKELSRLAKVSPAKIKAIMEGAEREPGG